ncbi:hypothetical protein MTO96_042210 [Rhipicephalus appendiculatus]
MREDVAPPGSAASALATRKRGRTRPFASLRRVTIPTTFGELPQHRTPVERKSGREDASEEENGACAARTPASSLFNIPSKTMFAFSPLTPPSDSGRENFPHRSTARGNCFPYV